MTAIGDIKVMRSSPMNKPVNDAPAYHLHVTIPKSVVDQFSYGMIHDRIRHATGAILQELLLERRAELLQKQGKTDG